MGGAASIFNPGMSASSAVGIGIPNCDVATAESQWYAVRTRPRHEKRVEAELQRKGIESFVPTIFETHYWSDRKKRVEVPVFPGYTFVNIPLTLWMRVAVLRVQGVVSFVGSENYGTPIPAEQIETVRKLVQSETPFVSHPFLKVGQKVEIKSGALAGTAGILTECGRRLVISVDAIAQALSIVVTGYDVRPA